MPSDRTGDVVIPPGVVPQQHERDTANRLSRAGFCVRFREVDRRPGAKNPDVDIDGELWEMKSPTGSSVRNTISEQFKSAKGQSENLVIDLARCGLDDETAIAQIRRRFAGQSRFTRVMILDRLGRPISLFLEGGRIAVKVAAAPPG